MEGGDPISPVVGSNPAPVETGRGIRRGPLVWIKMSMQRKIRFSWSFAAWGAAVGALAAFGFGCVTLSNAGYIINVTPSLPVGVYKRETLPNHLIDGDMIEICPLSPKSSPSMRQAIQHKWLLIDPKSPCADRLAPFLKRVAATPGQTVDLSINGVSVDGVELPKTAVKLVAANGKTLLVHFPFGRHTVAPNMIWVTDNSSPWAFDSRYYGPIPFYHVISGIKPVLTW